MTTHTAVSKQTISKAPLNVALVFLLAGFLIACTFMVPRVAHAAITSAEDAGESSAPLTLTTAATTVAQTVDDGTYLVEHLADLGLVLDTNGVKTPDSPAGLKRDNDLATQRWVVAYTKSGYTIKNAASGLYLGVKDEGETSVPVFQDKQFKWSITQVNKTSVTGQYYIKKGSRYLYYENGTLGITEGLSTQLKAKWHFQLPSTTNLIKDGIYSVALSSASNLSLTVPGEVESVGQQLSYQAFDGSQAQKYQFKAVAGKKNLYEIRIVHTGYYVSTTDKAKVIQSAYRQVWRAVSNNGGISLVNLTYGNVLTASTGTPPLAKGVAIRSDTAAQLVMLTQQPLLANGKYTLRPGSFGNTRVVGMYKASKKSGKRAVLAANKGVNSQRFVITQVKDDIYTIVNVRSKKALYASKKGTVVQYGTGTQARGQWRAVMAPGGALQFVNKATGKALALNGKNAAGTKLSVKKSNISSTKQKWYVLRVTKLRDYQQRALDKAKRRGSATNWYFVADITNHRFVVLHRKNKNAPWEIYRDWLCGSGKLDNGKSRTPLQDSVIKYRKERLDDVNKTWTTYYVTYWKGSYIHNYLYRYHSNVRFRSIELGLNCTNGCIRLDTKNAKWIYDHNDILKGSSITSWK